MPLLQPFQPVLSVTALVCSRTSTLPEVPMDPLFPGHCRKGGGEESREAGAGYNQTVTIPRGGLVQVMEPRSASGGRRGCPRCGWARGVLYVSGSKFLRIGFQFGLDVDYES